MIRIGILDELELSLIERRSGKLSESIINRRFMCAKSVKSTNCVIINSATAVGSTAKLYVAYVSLLQGYADRKRETRNAYTVLLKVLMEIWPRP